MSTAFPSNPPVRAERAARAAAKRAQYRKLFLCALGDSAVQEPQTPGHLISETFRLLCKPPAAQIPACEKQLVREALSASADIKRLVGLLAQFRVSCCAAQKMYGAGISFEQVLLAAEPLDPWDELPPKFKSLVDKIDAEVGTPADMVWNVLVQETNGFDLPDEDCCARVRVFSSALPCFILLAYVKYEEREAAEEAKRAAEKAAAAPANTPAPALDAVAQKAAEDDAETAYHAVSGN